MLRVKSARKAVAALALGAAAISAMAMAKASKPRVVFVGDSISSILNGYCKYADQGTLKDVADITCACTNSTGGGADDTTNASASDNTLRHIRYWLRGAPPEYVHINTGTWEVKGPTTATTALLDHYKANLNAIFDTILAISPKCKIVWSLTTPIDSAHYTKRRNSDIRAINQAASEVCKARGIPVLDLYTFSLTRNLGWADGIHYNDTSRAIQWNYISDAITGMINGTSALAPRSAPRAAGPRLAGRDGSVYAFTFAPGAAGPGWTVVGALGQPAGRLLPGAGGGFRWDAAGLAPGRYFLLGPEGAAYPLPRQP